MPIPNSGPIKTYKELADYLRSLALSHAAVHQFQIGDISDIDVQTNKLTPTEYPIVFMVPQLSSLDRGGKVLFGFSLIVADIAKNNTLMIMQDLLSRILLTDWEVVDVNLETPVNIVPFVERFNNNLAGWTAEINLELRSPFNLCQAAFE